MLCPENRRLASPGQIPPRHRDRREKTILNSRRYAPAAASSALSGRNQTFIHQHRPTSSGRRPSAATVGKAPSPAVQDDGRLSSQFIAICWRHRADRPDVQRLTMAIQLQRFAGDDG